MSRSPARLELDSSTRGPLKLVAIGIVVSFLIGIAIFALVSREETGDPAPPPGEAFTEPAP